MYQNSQQYPCDIAACWLEAVDPVHTPGWVYSPKAGGAVSLDEHKRIDHGIYSARQVSGTGGTKDQKDIQLSQMPYEALQELGRVYTFGARKYDRYNFRRGYAWSL